MMAREVDLPDLLLDLEVPFLIRRILYFPRCVEKAEWGEKWIRGRDGGEAAAVAVSPVKTRIGGSGKAGVAARGRRVERTTANCSRQVGGSVIKEAVSDLRRE